MKATLRIEKPDEIEASLTLTMTIGQWKRLREQLGVSYPSWRVGEAISQLVVMASQQFDHEVPIDES